MVINFERNGSPSAKRDVPSPVSTSLMLRSIASAGDVVEFELISKGAAMLRGGGRDAIAHSLIFLILGRSGVSGVGRALRNLAFNFAASSASKSSARTGSFPFLDRYSAGADSFLRMVPPGDLLTSILRRLTWPICFMTSAMPFFCG